MSCKNSRNVQYYNVVVVFLKKLYSQIEVIICHGSQSE